MGKSSPKMEVNQYYMSILFGACLGPVRLRGVQVDDRDIVAGVDHAAAATITVSLPNLFGGEKKEGGVEGRIFWLPGDDAQVLPDELAQRLGRANGADCPGYRGLGSLFFVGSATTGGFNWAANSPYIKPASATFTADPNELEASLSLIPNPDYPDKPDGNPAHMIYRCETNTDWGMGAPASSFDIDSYEAAAATLYSEGLGLSMLWVRQAKIEDFVSEILDHIQGVQYLDPETGLLTLKLVRGDYDPDELPVISPFNADLANFDRKLWGEIVNEIVVTWTNPANEQEETVVAQDLGSIAVQGGIVSDSRNYYGVRNANTAMMLAQRDLRSAGAPLCTCEALVDRTLWRIRPASVLKLVWPEYGLDGVIMRVTKVDYGKPGDPQIKVWLIEDIYGLSAAAYDPPPGSGWEDPSAEPQPMEEARIITLPAFLAANSVASNGGADPEYPEVVAGVLATTSDADTFGYELWDEITRPDGSTVWTSLGTNNILGRAALAADLAAEAESLATFASTVGQTAPVQGGFVLIGDSDDDETEMEIAMVVDTAGGFTLARGVLDTVPRAWAAGTTVWFVDDSTLFEDREVRSAGETVDYKLLTRTSQGLLALDDAPLVSYALTDRPWLPNRPANVQVNAIGFGEVDAIGDATVAATWSNRNKLTEDSQVLLWTDATVTPEVGQTTTITILKASDRSVLATHSALAGTSYDVPVAAHAAHDHVILRFTSELDGLESLQGHEIAVTIGASNLLLSGDATDGDDAVLLSGDEAGNRINLSGT